MTPLNILTQYWGHTQFRPLQEEIIQTVLQGKDVLALLPTGGGKSICFQIPALMQPGICLVVSPLIALMKDQVDQLKQKGIPAEAIFSGMSPKSIDIALDNCIYGKVKFLYVSPERLKTDLLRIRVQKMNVNLLAVDEAHCISQWGYDFRPAYLDIAEFKELLPEVNTIALTATATPAVQDDIQAKLHFQASSHFQQSFCRDNLAYVVRKTTNKEQQLLHILRHIPGTAIIYVNTRRKSQKIAEFLQKRNLHALAYHAGLSAQERSQRQESWIKGDTKIIVATNAFGMGIDKPDVRLVVHLDLPHTLEAYYQEAGRAGRDRKKSYAVILYDEQDLSELEENIRIAHPTLPQIQRIYQCLANYFQVAIGSNNLITYDLDWNKFITTYKLPSRESYQALMALVSEGIIQLNEIFFQPAQLHISASQQELYAFQVAHASYDHLIKVILRIYGGEIFSEVSNISVERLAQLLKVPIEAVHKQLQMLEKYGIIIYHPQKEQPQLTFITTRYPASQLPINRQALQQKMSIATQKAQSVIKYVTHQQRCREQILLAYFGEETDHLCRQCDVCLEKHTKALTDTEYEQHKGNILQRLQLGPQSLKDLVDYSGIVENKHVLTTIRHLLDQGEIAYEQSGRLVLCNRETKKTTG